MSNKSSILQFVQLNSSIDPTFWHNLTRLKLEVLKLEEEPIPIKGWYERGRWIKDRSKPNSNNNFKNSTSTSTSTSTSNESSNPSFDPSSSSSNPLENLEIGIGDQFRVDGNSFLIDIDKDHQSFNDHQNMVLGRVPVRGILKNFNKLEDFKSCDKQELFNSFSDDLWKNLTKTQKDSSQDDPKDENFPEFLIITFSDLKKYKYYYWFGFPAFVLKPSWVTDLEGWSSLSLKDSIELSESIFSLTQDGRKSFDSHWIAKKRKRIGNDDDSKDWSIGKSSDWSKFFDGVPFEERYLIFIDPSTSSKALGWPLRNILTSISSRNGSDGQKFRVISFRDPICQNQPYSISRSLVLTVELPPQTALDGKRPSSIGWEKNLNGKLGPRIADLAPMMDPTRLAEQAVDLNLKLMRWRILPDLKLEKISQTKCLILGAGTLGCYVARTLMAWGVKKITFVDSARVSYSNPVRQPLFEFDDCLEGGKPKAECAANALKRIYPGIDARGLELSIPMPGHPIPSNLMEKTREDVKKLEGLVDEHDVIYLLMDSRESRWLPTVLGASKRKLVMNAALGFDSYLVMRHGVRPKSLSKEEEEEEEGKSSERSITQIKRLGCYFCNDVVAPADSLTDRTLDQMCTVTRPGLAPIASATAVEIMAAVLQHPDGPEALAEVKKSDLNKDDKESSGLKGFSGGGGSGVKESVLGVVPHQIRGFLSKFENLKLVGPAYDRCTGCSERVIKAYEDDGFEGMLIRVFNEEKFLEKLIGLDELYEESEKVIESLDWDDEDE